MWSEAERGVTVAKNSPEPRSGGTSVPGAVATGTRKINRGDAETRSFFLTGRPTRLIVIRDNRNAAPAKQCPLIPDQ